MDKRGAPLPKKFKPQIRVGGAVSKNQVVSSAANNTKKADPIVVVESHKKFIQQKENEVSQPRSH